MADPDHCIHLVHEHGRCLQCRTLIYPAHAIPQGHLTSWRVEVQRRWRPLYTLTYDRHDPDPAPVSVEISAEFDNDQAARMFEEQVREWLEEFSPHAT